MKAQIFDKIIIAVFLLFFCSVHLTAQSFIPCGPADLDTAANKKAVQYLNNAQHRGLFATPKTIRVFFHVLSCDDGSFRTTSADSIRVEFNNLVEAYSADNICFINAGLDFIQNTKLDTNFTAGVDPASLFNPYRVANCINIFYVTQIKGKNSSCPGGCGFGGITLGVPNTFCLVASGNINEARRNTVAHEVGHCFGLLHTFNDNGYGLEDIDGTNGSTSADLVWDTNADPYNYDTTCNKSVYCNLYSGTCKDPKGSSGFVPPYNNVMSYWCSVTSSTRQSLTTGQFSRLEGFLNTYQPLINCISPNDITEGPISINNTNRIVTANNTLSTSGTVQITGISVVTYGANKVTVNDKFRAAPTGYGKVTIKVKQCE